MDKRQFQELIWQKATELYRPMPWREDTRGYYVLVSELMLQQTQVARVMPKFAEFIAHFPDEQALANAPLSEVLKLWQGLGYNRRARFLQQAAQMIARDHAGAFPDTKQALQTLPGVGKNTAGALLAYTFNQPALFVETNVRTVYIHRLFADSNVVTDQEILASLDATMDHEHPREWYWALMDYGAHLKAQGVKTNARSKHYKKQSPLEGSVRQVRGQIIKILTEQGSMTDDALRELLGADERYKLALEGLVRDGLIVYANDTIRLHA